MTSLANFFVESRQRSEKRFRDASHELDPYLGTRGARRKAQLDEWCTCGHVPRDEAPHPSRAPRRRPSSSFSNLSFAQSSDTLRAGETFSNSITKSGLVFLERFNPLDGRGVVSFRIWKQLFTYNSCGRNILNAKNLGIYLKIYISVELINWVEK